MILMIYCVAGIVGFVYSFFYQYDYNILLQDFQQTIYMVAFFLFTYHFVDTIKKWRIFVVVFLLGMVLKNIFILYSSMHGEGRIIGDWAIRSSQNSEFAYFPMMFFSLVLISLKTKKISLKIVLSVSILIYLYNSLIGIYRTVWVILILGSLLLIWQMEKQDRYKYIAFGCAGIAISLSVISIFFPKFLALAWNYKFASIFSWSVYGDRSNSTRLLEVINVTHRVFDQFSFLFGMGLGAWWDDSTRKLLPDFGSGFTDKSRYYVTHMWYLTQLLKIGIVGIVLYWMAMYKMIARAISAMKSVPWERWERWVLLGLIVGLICAFLSRADFVRLFLMIGINLGLLGRFCSFDFEKDIVREK